MFVCNDCTDSYEVAQERATWGRCELCGVKTRLNRIVPFDNWDILSKATGELVCTMRTRTNSPVGGITNGFIMYNTRTREVVY